MNGETHWYRIQASRYGHYDEDRDRVISYGYSAFVRAYEVVKHTPKGVWLYTPFEDNGVHGSRKFVKRDTRKRWACPTKMEALESFLQRKRRRVEILTAQIAKEKGLVAEAYRQCAKELEYPTDMPNFPEILKSGHAL